MQFTELNIMPSILKALERENYTQPTPVQEQAIPPVLSGRDLLGCAQTGTGKTAAFAIPTIQLLCEDEIDKTAKRKIRALVLTPTRELALQIFESFNSYGRFTDLQSCVIYGGVPQTQQAIKLRKGVDILVATPGRLNDLINQRLVDLKQVKMFILDEADRMLDMGFIDDVNRIIAKMPEEKQTLLFSATMPPEISKMADSLMDDPVKVSIKPSITPADIEQFVYFVDKENKSDLLLNILEEKKITSALVFTRTRRGADKLVSELEMHDIKAQSIHSDKTQKARQAALNNFKKKVTRVLVATDIAARGIDIDELPYVINFDLPESAETYTHRIGRTGRAGLSGIAVSFCDHSEKSLFSQIEKLIGRTIDEVKDHPYPMTMRASRPKNYVPQQKNNAPRQRRKTGGKNPSSASGSKRKKAGNDFKSQFKPKDSSRQGYRPEKKSSDPKKKNYSKKG